MTFNGALANSQNTGFPIPITAPTARSRSTRSTTWMSWLARMVVASPQLCRPLFWAWAANQFSWIAPPALLTTYRATNPRPRLLFGFTDAQPTPRRPFGASSTQMAHPPSQLMTRTPPRRTSSRPCPPTTYKSVIYASSSRRIGFR